MSFNKTGDLFLPHGQSACVALWNALGLTRQQKNHSLKPSLKVASNGVKADGAAENLLPLDYDVFFGYHPENDHSVDSDANSGREHTRHAIEDRFQFGFGSMLGYGQGVLHNISVSGAAIGVYRKLTIDQAIDMMVNSPDPSKRPIAVRLTVVRDAGATAEGLHSYGCRIDRVTDPNA